MANYILSLLMGIGMILLSGCSAEESGNLFPLNDGSVSVSLSIGDEDESNTRAPGDSTLSVDRVLILPFRKTNESLDNSPANFVPEYTSALQMDVNSFPVTASMLNLSATSTYQLVIIGYNRSDYDFDNQESATRSFNIGSVATPATLENLYLQPVSAPVVPEFFSCIGTGYFKGTLVGQTFKPTEVTNVQGTLTRLVSGLSLSVDNIPGEVESVTLAAEQLVTGMRITDAAPLTWQTAGDSGVKTLGTMAPVAGSVNFNLYMLPTTTTRNTLLYLDVTVASVAKRYTVKLADEVGLVSANRVTFDPNHWIRITGDYAKIEVGFDIDDNLNLDDDAWDGIGGSGDDDVIGGGNVNLDDDAWDGGDEIPGSGDVTPGGNVSLDDDAWDGKTGGTTSGGDVTPGGNVGLDDDAWDGKTTGGTSGTVNVTPGGNVGLDDDEWDG